jgi:homoserine dehydrogenase
MDGAPIFSLFDTLPVLHLRSFRGILNSTTNIILSGMAQGLSFDQSLKEAQDIGIAETDPTHDVEGWDATVKVAALVIVLMGAPIKLDAIERKGISGLSAEEVRTARAEGNPYKLVCRARRSRDEVTASVRPEKILLSDPLASISGTSSIVYFETDILPGLAITEMNPGVETTAYGMLADFIRAVGGDT